MAAEANEQMGFAFRPGKDYKPLQIMDQYRREQANSAGAQAEARQKQIADSQKFVKELAFNPDHINFEANKYMTKKANDFNTLTAQRLRERNYALSPEDQLELQGQQQALLGEQRLLKASNDELLSVSNGLLNNPDYRDLFNQGEASLNLKNSYDNVFTPEGAINKDWDPRDLRKAVIQPNALNESKVVERFANTIESHLNETIRQSTNGDIREISTKTNFAKLNSSGTDWDRDENGNVKLNVTPELVRSMRADEFTGVLLDKKLAEMQVDNPKASYTDAAEKLLQQSVKTERKESLKKPSDSDGGDGSKLNVSGWGDSENTTYGTFDTIVEKGGVLGKTGKSFNMIIPNFSVVYTDENGTEQAVKGAATGVDIDVDTGKPYLKIIDKNDQVQRIEFTENIYKAALTQSKSDADRKKLQENWKTKDQAAKQATNEYFDQQKAADVRLNIVNALQSNDSDIIENNVKAELEKAGVTFNTIEGNNSWIGENYVKIDGVKYDTSNVNALIRMMVDKAPKKFSSKLPVVDKPVAAPSTQQAPAADSKAEDLRKKYNY